MILSLKCSWPKVSTSSTRGAHSRLRVDHRARRNDFPIFWSIARTQNGDRMSILGTARWRGSLVCPVGMKPAVPSGAPSALLGFPEGPGALPGRIDVSGAEWSP